MAGKQHGDTWRPGRGALPVLMVLYALVLLVIAGVNRAGAEHWWLGALNLYLPQALWALPALPLLLLSPLAGRYWPWLPALCLAWVLGPIMGLCWSPRRPPAAGAQPPLRVLTCNAKFGLRDTRALFRDIVRYRPEVVLLQDANGLLASPLGRFFQGWQVRASGQYVIASRHPLSAAELLPGPAADGRPVVLRCQVDLGGTRVTLYNAHFQSPRDSLNAFRTSPDGWHPLDAIQDLERNAAVRLEQALLLRDRVAAETGPVLLAGDLNSPEPSRVCATLKEAGLTDAFSAGGRGYGYTYGHFLLQRRAPWLHLSWMRLDHIMAGPRLRVLRCWVGTGKASDHRPVIADLELEPR